MSIKVIKAISKADQSVCLRIRREVFIEEQGVSEVDELDNKDDASTHYLIQYKEQYVGTVRVRLVSRLTPKIERMAILKSYRGLRLGYYLMQFILEDIKSGKTANKVFLSSQIHAVSFYKKLGFENYGEKYMDAGIIHQDMELIL